MIKCQWTKSSFVLFWDIHFDWLRRRNFGQSGVFVVLWESSENEFGRPKNKVDKILEILKIRPPPLEKILDPPLVKIFM